MLAQRDDDAESLAREREALGWTTYQIADSLVLERFRADRPKWAVYQDRELRDAALKQFNDYAYQWY